MAMLALTALIEARGSSVARLTVPDVPADGGDENLRAIVTRVREATTSAEVVVVEGPAAVGLPIAVGGGTLADLAAALRYLGISSGVALVAGHTIDDANVMRLAAQVLAAKEVPLLGVIFDHRPRATVPDDVSHEVLAACTAPRWGALPSRRPVDSESGLPANAASWFEIL